MISCFGLCSRFGNEGEPGLLQRGNWIQRKICNCSRYPFWRFSWEDPRDSTSSTPIRRTADEVGLQSLPETGARLRSLTKGLLSDRHSQSPCSASCDARLTRVGHSNVASMAARRVRNVLSCTSLSPVGYNDSSLLAFKGNSDGKEATGHNAPWVGIGTASEA